MSTPRIEANVGAGIYVFRYLEERLAIRVDRLVDEKKSLWAEVTIKGSSPPMPGWRLIHREGFNLLVSQTRNRIAKDLLERAPVAHWPDVLAQIAEVVIEKHREGQPVVQVKDVTIPESIQWRLRPIIEEVDPTLIYGFGGGGKSYMAAYMSTLISEAFPTEGFDVEPGDILYLDYESNKVSFARRIHKIHNGLGLEQQSTIHYRRCAQPLTHDIHEVQRIVLERGIQMVVVDTAAPACGGEPETAKNAIQFFSALRSLSIPALVLAHKSKVTGAQGPFGSAFWWNNPRNVFLVKSEPSSDPDIVHLGIFHEKANEGRLQPPIGLRLEFTSSDAVHIHREDVRDVPEMADNVEIKDRIAIVLKRHGAMTRDEIVDELQEKPDSVSKALSRNKDTLFIRLSANRWGLHTRGWDS